ncbi:hypothetical protein [Arthrobacter sp. zg-Y895]|uniref:hypothetical protein n=1 Tax=Arthrobacter sp. zg-Y895 TaxID=2886933 RepID=UPI001D14DC6F|nr:hypothetical protein [Arthrobacter sp. zg-Y895]MCC3302778.1 hypothetical protein [Arthrobacter sp. zg-Y895]
MTTLTLHEVEQLVHLRLALEDATSRASHVGKYRRGSAIVALDAAVERASSMVAISRGVTIPTNGKLDDLISRLVQDFGHRWKPVVLQDIKHLRRARNASQHEGLEPDRDQVPLWAGATESYVASLIEAHFAVDIRKVVLSDAIRDDELRNAINEAERARETGDYRACVDHAGSAYRDALARWNRLRGRRGNVFTFSPTKPVDKKSYDYLSGKLREVQDVLGAVAFASNISEAEWFISTISEQGDVLNDEDAERVLGFAFEWIVDFERASESWTPSRQYRAAVGRRLVRSGAGPARIAECLVVEPTYRENVRALFRIADVPNEQDYPAWAQTLGELLPKRATGAIWRVLEDGTIEISKSAVGDVDFSEEMATLSATMVQAEEAVMEKLLAESERQKADEEKCSEYAASIAAVRADIPSWVTGVKWSRDEYRDHEELLVGIRDDVVHLRFGEYAPIGTFDNRKSLTDMLRERVAIQPRHGVGEYNFRISPVLSAPLLAKAFSEIDEAVRDQLEVQKRLSSEGEMKLLNAKRRIAAKLVELHGRSDQAVLTQGRQGVAPL